MTCAHRIHRECACEPGRCAGNPYGELLARKSRAEMWLAIAIALTFCAGSYLGYQALSRVEHQYQLEARI